MFRHAGDVGAVAPTTSSAFVSADPPVPPVGLARVRELREAADFALTTRNAPRISVLIQAFAASSGCPRSPQPHGGC
jgi:hypothetical protein